MTSPSDPRAMRPLPPGLQGEGRWRRLDLIKIATFARPRLIVHRNKWAPLQALGKENGSFIITYEPIVITLICGWRALQYRVTRRRRP